MTHISTTTAAVGTTIRARIDHHHAGPRCRLAAEDERMPVYVHVIDHPDARVLVDTGMTEPHPAWPTWIPAFSARASGTSTPTVDVVVNTHLHFDHCGGNHRFAASRSTSSVRELDDARSETTTRSGSGSMRPECGTCRSTASSSCCPGSARPSAGHTRVRRWSSSSRRGPFVIVGDVATASANSTNRTPKASRGCVRSTPSWSGSRTSRSVATATVLASRRRIGSRPMTFIESINSS